MEVDFAFLADSAEAVEGKLYVMGGAFDTIWAKTLPTIHPRLSFVMRLVFSPAETGRVHQMEVSIMDGDGKRLQTVGGPLELKDRNPHLPAGVRPSLLTVLNFVNLKFEKFGSYSFEIVFNNTSGKSVPLRIAQRVDIPI